MSYPVNPAQIIQMIKNGQNPQQLMLNILEGNMGNTPMGANLISLIKAGKTNDIEQIVRNLYSQKGVDFDKEFNAFKQSLGL